MAPCGMKALSRRALKGALWAAGVVLVVASGAGLVRLLPWLLAPDVPLEVSWPFARALAAAATETAYLIGVPLGFAFGMARATEAGEARALFAVGASPARLMLGLIPVGVALTLTFLAAAFAWDSGADRPGVFAGELITQARGGCVGAERPKSIVVPLVGVTWLCFPGRAPRVSGPLPGSGGRAWFSATRLTPSEDLRAVDLEGLTLAAKRGIMVSVHAKIGHVTGLPPWGRSAKLSPPLRAAWVGATTLLSSLWVAWAMLRFGFRSRAVALIVGGAPSLCALAALSRFEQSDLPRAAVAVVPAAALAALGLAVLTLRIAANQWRKRRRGAPLLGYSRRC